MVMSPQKKKKRKKAFANRWFISSPILEVDWLIFISIFCTREHRLLFITVTFVAILL